MDITLKELQETMLLKDFSRPLTKKANENNNNESLLFIKMQEISYLNSRISHTGEQTSLDYSNLDLGRKTDNEKGASGGIYSTKLSTKYTS